MTQSTTLRAPENQGVTFVELFFDLVFVFAVTKVTAMVAHDLTGVGVLRAVLVFWMIWWAWTQFTWALNPADTNHPVVRIGTLVATGITFLMALAVEDAFGDGGLRFVVPYILVRLVGLGLYARVTADRAEQLRAVRVFTAASLAGMAVALIGGFLDPAIRFWVWLAVIVLDFAAAAIGARREGWGLNAAHFTERHGLFVIIALGESLIAAGVAASTASRGTALVAVGSVAVVCLLWWSYFGWLKDRLEHAMAGQTGAAQSRFARDVYSLIHFPLIAGVIGVAVGIEEMVAHPFEAMHGEAVSAFAGGIVLFVGSSALACQRALHRALVPRLALMVLLVAAYALLGHPAPTTTLAVAVAILMVLAVVEARGDGAR